MSSGDPADLVVGSTRIDAPVGVEEGDCGELVGERLGKVDGGLEVVAKVVCKGRGRAEGEEAVECGLESCAVCELGHDAHSLARARRSWRGRVAARAQRILHTPR